MNDDNVNGFAFGFLLAIIAVLVISIITHDPTYRQEWHVDTDCPVEDACYPEYADGEWYIIEGDRP